MTAHIHAESMKLYAQDASEIETPLVTISGPSPRVGYVEDATLALRALPLLSWSEPLKTKTVYQWAYYIHDCDNWVVSCIMATDESEWRNKTGMMNPVKRLDYSALEVPDQDSSW
jgi:hypothetical protein